jgi:hypothetical protein
MNSIATHPDPLVVGAERLPLAQKSAVPIVQRGAPPAHPAPGMSPTRRGFLVNSIVSVASVASAVAVASPSAVASPAVSAPLAAAHPLVSLLAQQRALRASILDYPDPGMSDSQIDAVEDRIERVVEAMIAEVEPLDLAGAIAAVEALQYIGRGEGDDDPDASLFYAWRHAMTEKLAAFLRGLAATEGGLAHA